MQIRLITDNHSRRLTLLYAGWAMDSAPFAGLVHKGADLAVVWDYTSLDTDGVEKLVASYDEVNVVAWSFGVYAASVTLAGIDSRISRRIAVNGTCFPVDDRRGIPPQVFRGTLENLDERNLRKFYRRMCVSAEEFSLFALTMPGRGADSARKELEAFAGYTALRPQAEFRWDFAMASRHDAIIPFDAQLAAWRTSGIEPECADSGHLPDFQYILDAYIVDKPLMAERFGRAACSYEQGGDPQRLIAARLAELCSPHFRSMNPARIIEAGSGTGMLTRLYAPLFPDAEILLCDLVPYHIGLEGNIRQIRADAETAIANEPDGSADLILSASAMQWFSSPEAFIANSLRVLRKDGLLAVSTFSPDNLRELSDITRSRLAVPDADTLREAALRAGAEILTLESGLTEARFETPQQMLEHLKQTGVTGIRHHSPRTAVRRIIDNYPRESDGSLCLRYRPIYLILKKKR